MPSGNTYVDRWVDEVARLTTPDRVVFCDGSEAERQRITDDLAADLKLMNRMPQLDDAALSVLADLVVKTVFATLPELIDPPAPGQPTRLSAEAKIIQQLRFIMIGGKHWHGLGKPGG